MRYSVIVTRDVTMTQSCVVEVEASGADEAENKAIEASGTVHRGNGGSAIMTTETKHTPELAAAINALLDRPESNRHLINYLTQLEMQRSELAAALRSQIEPRAKGWVVTDWAIRDAEARAVLAKLPT